MLARSRNWSAPIFQEADEKQGKPIKSARSTKRPLRRGSPPFVSTLRVSIPLGGRGFALLWCAVRALARQLPSNDCGDLRGVDLVSRGCPCEVRGFLKGLPRVVAGTIQVGNESAHNEEAVSSAVFMACSVEQTDRCPVGNPEITSI